MVIKRGPESAQRAAVRVAIVGGGCAGLATAWQLHRLNQQRQQLEARFQQGDADARQQLRDWPVYAIDVYEADHKLGGKGASERDADGRIIDHGLHVWLGFYENAFRLMREVYAEAAALGLGPAAPKLQDRLVFATFDEAFRAEPHIGVASARRDGSTEVWSGFLPPMKGEPGTPLDEGSNPFTWWGYAARALALVRALMLSTVAPAAGETQRSSLDEAVELDFEFDPSRSPAVLLERLTQLLRAGALTTVAGLLQGVTLLENWLRDGNPAPQLAPRIFRFIEALATQTRRQLRDLAGLDEVLRRKTEIIDLVMTILVGLWRDRVYFSPRGLDAIDGIDYREWLRKHGATRGAIESPLITGIYDLVFGYRDGRHDRPALSAGQAIRGALRMFFTYRGSMFWRLNAGMGEVMFAPLLRVLVQAGVRFHFGHSLAAIGFDSDTRPQRVLSLQFETVAAGQPLSVVAAHDKHWPLDHLGCWPTADRSALIRDWPSDAGPGLLRLDADQHFDAVVFAHGIDAFVQACGETASPAEAPRSSFFTSQPQWDAMRRSVRSVATCSAQVWLSRGIDDLGWQRGAVVVAGLAAPIHAAGRIAYETWADMTHTLATERRWRASAPGRQPDAADQARSVAYFCGVVDESLVKDGKADQAARQALADLLRQGMAPYWPALEGEDASHLLVGADGRLAGLQSMEGPVVVVNAHGSARYTQALPSSGVSRLSPLGPWFDNATIAGDWTDAGFNGGCVETAVMSGLLAAHAISGRVDLNSIVGYHHP